MSQNPNPQGGQPQQINLQQIAQNFMAGLQKHFDMLAFNLASRSAATEEAYNRAVAAPLVQPAPQHHQNFEQMQAYAYDLLMRQMLNDSMNLVINCLNNAHFFLALVKTNGARSEVSAEAQKETQKLQAAFLKAPLDQKFDQLEKNYGIMCELEDTLTSLGFALQALVQNRGVVQEAHLNSNGELIIELKTVELTVKPIEGKQAKGRLVDQKKVYHKDDMIEFSDTELQLILVTLGSFADSLFKSVSEYARTTREGS
ncbi:MAG: hypothetical protein AAGH40_04345 [Verrucomicrobiota bacterium]